MLVSVIIPAYNRKQTISRAIKSVLHQTVPFFEIRVVDDASTDGTGEFLLREFHDKRLFYHRFEENKGVAEARNYGINVSKGDFLVFFDSDDELLPEALENAYEVFLQDKDEKIGLVGAPLYLGGVFGALTSYAHRPSGILSYEEILCEQSANSYKGGFNMLRRSSVGETRFVATNLDFIFYRRIAKDHSFYFLSQPLGIYHLSSQDAGALHKTRRKANVALSIKRASALADFLSEFEADLLRHCPRFLSYYAYGAAVGTLLDGNQLRAVRFAAKAVRYNWVKLRYLLFFLFSVLPFSSFLLRVLFVLKKRFFEHQKREET